MTSPPDVEIVAGMEVYATKSVPCYGRIRSTDEDFRVRELLDESEIRKEPFPGCVPLYEVEKKSIDTFHMERRLSEILRSRVRYAGLKDKRAVAVQYVTPTSWRPDFPQLVEEGLFRCRVVGYLDRPISRSMVLANGFVIVVRDCCPSMEASLEEASGLCRERKVPNFYGLQRFGTSEALTHRLGRAMVKGSFGEATRLMLEEPRSTDNEDTSRARALVTQGRVAEALDLLPRRQDIERMVAKSLASDPGDPVKALRAVPIALRRFYVQAYQSFIFNRTLSVALKRGLDISEYERGDNWGELADDGLRVKKVHGVRDTLAGSATPLVQMVGYGYRDYGSRFDECLEEVMGKEGVAAADFYVRDMQEVSVEGGFRRAHLPVKGFSHSMEGDVATLEFGLGRGAYATVLLREVLKPPDPAAAGFG